MKLTPNIILRIKLLIELRKLNKEVKELLYLRRNYNSMIDVALSNSPNLSPTQAMIITMGILYKPAFIPSRSLIYNRLQLRRSIIKSLNQ